MPNYRPGKLIDAGHNRVQADATAVNKKPSPTTYNTGLKSQSQIASEKANAAYDLSGGPEMDIDANGEAFIDNPLKKKP